VNEEELLREMALAQEAITQGAPKEYVDAQIAQRTGYPNLFALRMSIESAQDFQAAEEMKEIGEHPVRNFMGAAAQGASFGWADELIGALGFEGTARKMDRAQDLREEHAPGANAAAMMAGGLMLPGIPAAGAARMAPGATRGLLAGAARGGLYGGLAGAATGAGLAEDGSRLEGAATGAGYGAAGGAVVGAPFGALGGVMASRTGRGSRVAGAMRELSDLSGTRAEPLGRIRADKQFVQESLYGPLQQAHPAVTDRRVLDFMTRIEDDGTFRADIPRRLRGNQATSRSRPVPSFEDLQDLRGSLRGRARNRAGELVDRDALARAEELDEIMQDLFGEPLQKADSEWARVSANQRSLESGWRLYNRESEIVNETMRRMSPEQRDYFNEGRLARVVAKLEEDEAGAGALLKDYFNAGPEMRRRMASMFPGGEEGTAFQTLQNMMRSEARNEAIAQFFGSSVKGAAVGAAVGAATTSAMMNLFGDREP
jgi:hypothetical protein